MGNNYRLQPISQVDTSTINPLALRDYTPSLLKAMDTDKYGFFHSNGQPVILSDYRKKTYVYTKDGSVKIKGSHCNEIKTIVNRELRTLVLSPTNNHIDKNPCVVVCLGGPFCSIPDINATDSIYAKFADAGFYVVVTLRHGVDVNNNEWTTALRGHYGIIDVNDIVQGTHDAIDNINDIDKEHIYLYGASYGGYTAQLIAGKHNQNRLYKAIVSHCGVFNLANYPWHCMALPNEVMLEYANTSDPTIFRKRIKKINPASYVDRWQSPMLFVHTLDDATCWFGQSVEAYNAGLRVGAPVHLLLAAGPHSYNIKNGELLINEIINFINSSDL